MNRVIVLFCLLLCLQNHSAGQVIDYAIPRALETKINATDYKRIVDASVAIVSKHFKIDSVKDGTVSLVKMQDIIAFHLNNLILECTEEPDKAKWDKIISEHFNMLFATLDKDDELDPESFKDSKKYLSLRIYPKEFITQRPGYRGLVVQTNLEDTYTLLMLDVPSDAFVPVPRKNFIHWNKDIDEVFQLAKANINRQPVQKIKQSIDAGGVIIETTTLKNDDYAGSYALDLDNNSPELVGELGAIVAIPNKGIAYTCKIVRNQPVKFTRFIEKMKGTVEQEYNGHPQQISNQFYWYYKDKFTRINVSTDKDGKIIVTPPAALMSLMNKAK